MSIMLLVHASAMQQLCSHNPTFNDDSLVFLLFLSRMFKFQVLLSVIVALLSVPTQASATQEEDPRSLRGSTLSKNPVAGGASSSSDRTLSMTTIDPVDLGTAGNFAILSKSGVSTTPGSNVCGNVGTSPIAATALTGFSLTPTTAGDAEFSASAMVTGHLYGASHSAPTPAMLSASVSAMEAAYTDAAGRANPDEVELFAGSFPASAVLVPGIYKWSSVVTVPVGGTVTFYGSSTDQWIMQIAGNLAIGTNASILLTNGAKAENIFWAVAGDIAVGVDAHAEGIFLTYTMIAMKTGSSLNGAAYAQTAVTLDAATVINDTTDPVLLGVPANITVECDNVPAKSTDVTVTDSGVNPVSPAVVSYKEVRSGTGICAADGYTLIRTWMAIDACGNVATAAQTITVQNAPSVLPSAAPIFSPSDKPSVFPSATPSVPPSDEPSAFPSSAPSTFPSAAPSAAPTAAPSAKPTAAPTAAPSAAPSAVPSAAPTSAPTPRAVGVVISEDSVFSLLSDSTDGTEVETIYLGDDDTTIVDIGFAYNWFGEDLTQLVIQSNGQLFMDTSNTDTEYDVYPIGSYYFGSRIAFAASDINPPRGGTVKVGRKSGADESFKVSFEDVNWYPNNGEVNVQVELFPNGDIIFCYGSGEMAGRQMAAGVENSDLGKAFPIPGDPFNSDGITTEWPTDSCWKFNMP
jgi:hypothetical protein